MVGVTVKVAVVEAAVKLVVDAKIAVIVLVPGPTMVTVVPLIVATDKLLLV